MKRAPREREALGTEAIEREPLERVPEGKIKRTKGHALERDVRERR